jgi:predicted HTH domain antitoxin
MQTVTMELPEEVFSALRRSPDEFAREMRLAAAMLWYSRRMISQEKGAQIAGINRAEFLAALAQNKINVFAVDFDDLQRELSRG